MDKGQRQSYFQMDPVSRSCMILGVLLYKQRVYIDTRWRQTDHKQPQTLCSNSEVSCVNKYPTEGKQESIKNINNNFISL